MGRPDSDHDGLRPRHLRGLRLVQDQGRMTRREYAKGVGVSERSAKRDLAELVERGVLRQTGAGRNLAYVGLQVGAGALPVRTACG